MINFEISMTEIRTSEIDGKTSLLDEMFGLADRKFVAAVAAQAVADDESP